MNNGTALIVENGVGINELARPEKFNCLSLAVIRGIDEARNKFEADPDVRVILVRAQGKYFCTGTALEEVKNKRRRTGCRHRSWQRRLFAAGSQPSTGHCRSTGPVLQRPVVAATEAQSVGLVNQVVADEYLWDEAMAYCVELTTRSRTGIAEMKRLAREGLEMPLVDSMKLERVAAVPHILGDHVAEGLDAVENGRTPEFKQ